MAQHPTPHDDGTVPWRERGTRTVEQITRGVEELRGRGERAAFLAGLIDSGELEYYGSALVLGLATSWGLRAWQVRRLVQDVYAAAALNPQTRAMLVGTLAGELDTIRRKSVRDGAYGPAVQAVLGKAKVFGIVGGAPLPPPPADEGDDPSMVAVEGVTCGACHAETVAARFCGQCGSPLEAPAAPAKPEPESDDEGDE